MKSKVGLLLALVAIVAMVIASSPATAAKPGIPPGQADDLAKVLDSAEVYDLTATVAEDLPGWWPSHMPFQAKVYNWFLQVPSPYYNNETGDPYLWVDDLRGNAYYTRWYIIDEHVGTHYDTPAHFTPPTGVDAPYASDFGQMTNEEVPLRQLVGPAVVIDVKSLLDDGDPGMSPRITKDHITAWEAENGEIENGEIVLFRGGYDDKYYTRENINRFVADPLAGKAVGWPAPTPEAVEYLFDQGVRHVGIDSPSMGPADDGAPTHQAVLPEGMIYSELLVNLDPLPARGSYFMFLPIKTEGGSGAPGRAIAFVPGTDGE